MLLLSALLALAAPEDQVMTNAYGETIRWATPQVEYVVDPANQQELDEAAVVAAVAAADDAWDGVASPDFAFAQVGRQEGFHGGYDEVSGVYFSDDWTSSPELLALTSVWSDQEGYIQDFDMAVNQSDHAWALDGSADKIDLWNALAHEFGHAIGLGHDESDVEATMYPSSMTGELSKRDLSQSDEEAAAYLYDGAFAEVDAEAQGFGCNAAPGVVSMMGFGIVFLSVMRRKEVA